VPRPPSGEEETTSEQHEFLPLAVPGKLTAGVELQAASDGTGLPLKRGTEGRVVCQKQAKLWQSKREGKEDSTCGGRSSPAM